MVAPLHRKSVNERGLKSCGSGCRGKGIRGSWCVSWSGGLWGSGL